MSTSDKTPTGKIRAARISGPGRILVAVYGVLAVAALGRSIFQIIDRFDEAPLAYSLSALSALVYVVATACLVIPGRLAHLLAWATISFELAGVLVVGTLSVVAPEALGLSGIDPFGRSATVWSVYGAGYVFVPLVVPVLGMLWLAKHPVAKSTLPDAGAA